MNINSVYTFFILYLFLMERKINKNINIFNSTFELEHLCLKLHYEKFQSAIIEMNATEYWKKFPPVHRYWYYTISILYSLIGM